MDCLELTMMGFGNKQCGDQITEPRNTQIVGLVWVYPHILDKSWSTFFKMDWNHQLRSKTTNIAGWTLDPENLPHVFPIENGGSLPAMAMEISEGTPRKAVPTLAPKKRTCWHPLSTKTITFRIVVADLTTWFWAMKKLMLFGVFRGMILDSFYGD